MLDCYGKPAAAVGVPFWNDRGVKVQQYFTLHGTFFTVPVEDPAHAADMRRLRHEQLVADCSDEPPSTPAPFVFEDDGWDF